MNLEGHADSSFGRCGLRAPDIHRWIDGYFDPAGFKRFLISGNALEDDPFAHRSHRHCREAEEDALREFSGRYSEAEIRAVFESHLMDDYDGYVPSRADFDNPRFLERYHAQPPSHASEPVLSQAERERYFGAGKGASRGARAKPSAFSARILIPTLIAVSLFLISLVVVIEPVFHGLMMDGKRRMLRELVATAVSVLDWYRGEEARGALGADEARGLARAELGKIRYGDDSKDYFWIIDTSVTMVMHPWRPELNGQNLTDYRDSEAEEGKNLFAEAVALCKAEGEGYLEYLWQWKDEPGKLVPKLSYVRLYEPWDWIVGSGVYIHDVEAEIAAQSNRLLAIFGVISVVSVLIMVGVLLQARSAERARSLSESALEEARDRYSALVNSSREAHGLLIGDAFVYTNPRMRELTGYGEEELVGKGAGLLFPDLQGEPSAWAEGQEPKTVRCKDGTLVPVRVTASRVFFSRDAGTVVSILPAKTKLTEYLEAGGAPLRDAPGTLAGIGELFERTADERAAFDALAGLTAALPDFLHEGRNPEWIRRWVHGVWKAFSLRIAEFALRGCGEPPAPFALVALGSNGRGEMTLFSDQDNAIVFDDSRARAGDIREWYLSFARSFCASLDAAGFRYCPGGILASNEQWCLGLREWKTQIARWASLEVPDGIQRLHALWDSSFLFGGESLAGELREHVANLRLGDAGFLPRFARPVLAAPPPSRHGLKDLNIKGCLLILEGFARVYSLEAALPETSSVPRVDRLAELGRISPETRRDFTYAFESLWKLRFRNQLSSWSRLEKNGDALRPESLTEAELRQVGVLLKDLPVFSQKLNRDFFGGYAEA